MADKPKGSIDRFKDLIEAAEQIGDTAELAHSEAYVKAANAVLKGKNGRINRKLLDKAEHQEKFAKAMAEHYLTKANEHFGSKIKTGDQIEADQLMNAYAKVTYNELHNSVRGFKSDYSVKRHEENRDELISKLRGELSRSASGHLTENDKGSLVKSMKAEGFIDPNLARIDDLVQAYNIYKDSGSLSRESLSKAYQRSGRPSPAYLKKEKK